MNLGRFYWIYTSRCIPCFWFIFPIANKSSRCNVELWCQRHQHWATDWLGMWLRSSPLRETSRNALNEIRSFEEWSHTAGEQQQSAKRVSFLQVSDMARRAQSVSFHPNNKWINNINPSESHRFIGDRSLLSLRDAMGASVLVSTTWYIVGIGLIVWCLANECFTFNLFSGWRRGQHVRFD